MRKIYLASAYGRMGEMRVYKDVVEAMGYPVTSRWLLQDPANGTPQGGFALAHLNTQGEVAEAMQRALMDATDIYEADIMVSFTDGQFARGGRHVELGMALAWVKTVVVIGPREHVFHCLPDVIWFEDWESFHDALRSWKEVPDWDHVPT